MGLFDDYTFRTILLGCLALGAAAGCVGALGALKGQALMGDVMAHASLPGLCLAFVLAGGRVPAALMVGGALSAWLASWLALSLAERVKLDPSAAMASVLSGFFGLGVLALSWIQRLPGASAGGLDAFFFGQAAALVEDQVALIAVVGGAAALGAILIMRPYRAAVFDPEFARVSGVPSRAVSAVVLALLIAAIVVGLSAVGVVLMSAMLVAPSVAVRPWTKTLTSTLALSALVGGGAGLCGAWASIAAPGSPTGPVIALFLGLLAALSLGASSLIRRKKAEGRA